MGINSTVNVLNAGCNLRITSDKAADGEYLCKDGKWRKISCLERAIRAICSRIFTCCVASNYETAMLRSLKLLNAEKTTAETERLVFNPFTNAEAVGPSIRLRNQLQMLCRVVAASPVARPQHPNTPSPTKNESDLKAAPTPYPSPLQLPAPVTRASILNVASPVPEGVKTLRIESNLNLHERTLDVDVNQTVGHLKSRIMKRYNIDAYVANYPAARVQILIQGRKCDDADVVKDCLMGKDMVVIYVDPPEAALGLKELKVSFAGQGRPNQPMMVTLDIKRTVREAIEEIKTKVRKVFALPEDSSVIFSLLIMGNRPSSTAILADVLADRKSLILRWESVRK